MLLLMKPENRAVSGVSPPGFLRNPGGLPCIIGQAVMHVAPAQHQVVPHPIDCRNGQEMEWSPCRRDRMPRALTNGRPRLLPKSNNDAEKQRRSITRGYARLVVLR